MAVHDELGTRMKFNYEEVSKTRLLRRTPVAIRIDGKAFHTFTRGLQKPFDEILIKSMQDTMKYLCENIQGCVFGYTQSDEITLILIDYQTLTSQAWFNYEVQKMCSIAASMATMAFNKAFKRYCDEWGCELLPNSWWEGGSSDLDELEIYEVNKDLIEAYNKAIQKGAMFDARCFNIPKEEVTNLIYWRQLDATRNSIEMVGHANFSQKELHCKSCNDIQDMLHEQKGINWNDFPTEQKRGSACLKGEEGWYIDHEMPILKGEDRAYVDKLINV